MAVFSHLIDVQDKEETTRMIIQKELDYLRQRKSFSQSTGFEPVRGDPNGFLVHRLNHSATIALPLVTLISLHRL